jgi:hypothetical protein
MKIERVLTWFDGLNNDGVHFGQDFNAVPPPFDGLLLPTTSGGGGGGGGGSGGGGSPMRGGNWGGDLEEQQQGYPIAEDYEDNSEDDQCQGKENYSIDEEYEDGGGGDEDSQDWIEDEDHYCGYTGEEGGETRVDDGDDRIKVSEEEEFQDKAGEFAFTEYYWEEDFSDEEEDEVMENGVVNIYNRHSNGFQHYTAYDGEEEEEPLFDQGEEYPTDQDEDEEATSTIQNNHWEPLSQESEEPEGSLSAPGESDSDCSPSPRNKGNDCIGEVEGTIEAIPKQKRSRKNNGDDGEYCCGSGAKRTYKRDGGHGSGSCGSGASEARRRSCRNK